MAERETELILDKYTKEYADDPEFIAEGLAIKITEKMLELLERRDLNQSWLADKMGVSRARISNILNAQPNMTLLTIAKIAVALDVKPDVCLDAWSLNWIQPVPPQPQKVDIVWAASETKMAEPEMVLSA
jgi:transcriptional regulator with XRE-family HTH domain